ncbi:MAG: ABC transporter permease, partial [Kibdelosporangium sp.]
MAVIELGPLFAVALVLLEAGAAVVVWLGRLGAWHSVVTAAVRAAVQLAAVSLLITAVLGSGLVPAKPIAIVPIAGILIGGAMTATSLAGRRALDELRSRHGEYEAALALGLLPATPPS